MDPLYTSFDATTEQAIVDSITTDEPWSLLERFSSLIRESGSSDEQSAAQYIVDKLKLWGIPHQVFYPELYLSVPHSARIEVIEPEPVTFRAKTPGFSRITGDEGLYGEAVYVPGQFAQSLMTFFETDGGDVDAEIHDRIVLTEGMGGPGPVALFEERGALGQIYVNPGEDIHWGICTTVWGTPDLNSFERIPKSVVVAVNRPDGEKLIEWANAGILRVKLYTDLTQGWFPCPLIVAEIRGFEEPDKFVLLHGHLDSWDVGIGDNAVGNATKLELARVFWQHRSRLKRTIRIAWWPGHSTGRYGGSTWYADNFGLELIENCIAQVNVDSLGCRWATEYNNVFWMSETEDFCVKVIRDTTGKDATGSRPLRAGDYSFNNIGVTSFFMLTSTMPDDLRARKDYYAVGGCGGNIAWHTEHDTLEIADRDNLLRDMRLYAAAVSRAANSTVHPFDFRLLASEFIDTLERYQLASQGHFSLEPALVESRRLQDELEVFYRRVEEAIELPIRSRELQILNRIILDLARLLVPINFTRNGLFRHDPALPIPPFPDLSPIQSLPNLDRGSDLYKFTQTHLRRGQNRVVYALRQARRLVLKE